MPRLLVVHHTPSPALHSLLTAALDGVADPALAVDEPNRLVVCVGRLRSSRGLDLLLEAFRRVAARRPEPLLWFVGEGPDAAYLRERVFELGLALVASGLMSKLRVSPYVWLAGVCAGKVSV